jgi:hypothetical protein
MRQIAAWMNSPEILPTPLCQRKAGRISEICFQFAHKFISKSIRTEIWSFIFIRRLFGDSIRGLLNTRR